MQDSLCALPAAAFLPPAAAAGAAAMVTAELNRSKGQLGLTDLTAVKLLVCSIRLMPCA